MKVGFIGLGVQGKPLALNIVNGGHDVSVFDLRPEPLAELRARGAHIADSPAEIGALAEVVIICVMTDAQVETVMNPRGGLLERPVPGMIIAIHSTVAPETIKRIGELAARHGVSVVDAPVSGGERGARERTMSFIVGGEEAAIGRCEPIFALSGTKITRTGVLGSATVAKLAHQVAVCGNILAMAEAVRLARAAGISTSVIKQVIGQGAAQSYIADTWGEIAMAPHAIPLFRKDLKHALKLAEDSGVALPGIALIQPMLEAIVPGSDRRSEG